MSKINNNQIKDDAIDSSKVLNDSIQSEDVKDGSLTNEDLSNTAGIELKKLDTTGANDGDFIGLQGGVWTPKTPSSIGLNYSSSAEDIGTTSGPGTADTVARGDHVHAHGVQTDDTLHAAATTSSAGFLSASDKSNLDNSFAHTTNTDNPHSVTQAQVGLGNVDNTSDLDKPISTATQAVLNNKEDAFTKNTAFNKDFGTTSGTVCEGDDSRLSDTRDPNAHASTHTDGTDDIQDATISQKGLMTAAQATKLDGIEAGADVTDSTNVDAAGAVMNSDTSTTAMSFVIDEDNMSSNLDTKVPTQQSVKAYVDSMAVGSTIYQGVWDASTNTPTLTSSTGTQGFYYKVSVAGTTALDGINDWGIGDWAIFNGTTWDKVDNTDSVSSVAGKTGAVTLDKSDVGLSNVDNTSDLDKPISTATQAALDNKEDSFTKSTAFNKDFGSTSGTVCEGDDSRLSDTRDPNAHASTHTNGTDDIQDATTSQKGLMTPTQASNLDGAVTHISDTDNPHSVTQAQVGLGNVDNTSDLDKPISTAAQAALDDKEDAFAKNTAFNKDFGTTSGTVCEGDDSRLSDTRDPNVHASTHTDGTDDIQDATTSQKGLMTPTQASNLDGAVTHISDTDNPHSVTQTQVGLSNVDNTSDLDKPISTATQAALDNKEDAFTKNTAFNKDFGTTSGTVCEGDDSRLSDTRDPNAHASTHTDGTDDIQDATTSQKGLMTAAQATKLDGIETGADVTDSTNVDAAGAVMNSDTSTTGMAFVIDEDNMVSNSDTKIPTQQSVKAYVDSMSVGSTIYQGIWDASTNTPTLTSSTGTQGFYYKVSVAGTTALDGINDWGIGDWAIFNGTTWDKVDNTDSVSSVAGKTGAVTLDKSDVGLSNVDNTSDLNKPISTATQAALDNKEDAFAKNTAFNKNFGTGTITTVGTVASPGVSTDIPRFDHVHPHGNLAGGSLHALATTSNAGFMSPSDKTILLTLTPGAINANRFNNVEGLAATTSTTTYSTYQTWTPTDLDAGDYIIRWLFKYNTDFYTTVGEFVLLVDSVEILNYKMAPAYDSNEEIAAAGAGLLNIATGGTHTIQIRFRTNRYSTSTRRTTRMFASYIELITVS